MMPGRPVASITTILSVNTCDVLREATRDGTRRIRLLKIDCEGAEYPILLTTTQLHLVDEICGEYHNLPAEITAPWGFGGTVDINRLADHLVANGFEVDIMPYTGSGSNAGGLFFARRE